MRALSLLAVTSLVVAGVAPVSAQRVVRADDFGRARLISELDLVVRGVDDESRARDAIARLPELGATTDALIHVRTLDAHGARVVRFVREVDSLPVLGSSVVVRIFERDGVHRADLVVADLGAPRLVGQASVRPPLSDALSASGFAEPRVGFVQAVAFDVGEHLVPAYAIEVDGHAHERRRLVYAATDGRLLANVDLIRNLGRVYDPNPPVALEMTSDVEIDNLTSARFLTGRYVRASSCDPAVTRSCEPTQRARADDDGNFFYEPEDPSFTDEFSEVNVYFHTDRVAAYFRDTHALEWTCCDTSSVIDVLANYSERPGTPYDNAFYAPSSCGRERCALMAFGQGARDFGYDGDVVYHEFGHGIVDVTATLAPYQTDREFGIGYEPGALNEGIADYFSATLGDDPQLADYFAGVGEGEGSLRNLDNDRRCPDDLFGEVHRDGEIWGGTLWSIREAIGAEKADRLAFATLVALTSDADFDDAGALLLATAPTLEGFDAADIAEVERVVAERGLVGCQPVAPLLPGVENARRGFSGLDSITGNLGDQVAPIRYVIDVPADATRLRVEIRTLTPFGRYRLHARVGSPPRRRFNREPPVSADGSFGSNFTLTESELAELPLPRCERLFIAIETTDLLEDGPSIYEISATMELSETPRECPSDEPDAGAADAGADAGLDAGADGSDASVDAGEPGEDDGCGCNAPGSPSTASPAATLALVAAWGWRRRRRAL